MRRNRNQVSRRFPGKLDNLARRFVFERGSEQASDSGGAKLVDFTFEIRSGFLLCRLRKRRRAGAGDAFGNDVGACRQCVNADEVNFERQGAGQRNDMRQNGFGETRAVQRHNSGFELHLSRRYISLRPDQEQRTFGALGHLAGNAAQGARGANPKVRG